MDTFNPPSLIRIKVNGMSTNIKINKESMRERQRERERGRVTES